MEANLKEFKKKYLEKYSSGLKIFFFNVLGVYLSSQELLQNYSKIKSIKIKKQNIVNK